MNPSEYISIISFPGLGIGEFPVNRLAFRLFGIDIMWYGVIICFGIIVAFSYLAWRANQVGINLDAVLDYTLWTVPIAVLGARLYYVLFSLKDHSYSSFWDVISPRDGGLAIYGGVIVGALMVFLVAKHKKQSFCMMGDMVIPGVMIAQAIGRWGNFMNAEAYGGDTTLPWRMGIRKLGMSETRYVHPTFFYESLWNVIGFTLINIFYKKRKFHGQIILEYACWYGLGRMFIEGLRTDSLYIGSLRVSQIVAGVGFVLSAVLIAFLLIRHKKMAASGVIGKDEIVDITVLLGIKPPKSSLAMTGEVQFDTSEFERTDSLEQSEAKKRAMARSPFEQTAEFSNDIAKPEFEVNYENEQFGTPDEYKDKTVIHTSSRDKVIAKAEEAMDEQIAEEEKEEAEADAKAEAQADEKEEESAEIEAEEEAEAEAEAEEETEAKAEAEAEANETSEPAEKQGENNK